MTMVYVPAGTFQMGSNWRDRSANEYEKPPHLVTLDAFWIDRTEVTNAQHAHCVAAGVCQISAFAYDARFNGADYPVVGVGWQDAADYCRWVGGRLPTEAEWEYAARGPGGHIYPWGNDPPDDTLLNYNGNVGDTTKVGSYPKGQSWVGALDMAGNVWEWVNDWYGEYPSEPQVNPTGPTSGEYRVARGSSWDDDRNYARVAIRSRIAPDLRYIYIGFRCASGLP
jgi:formylglycine-generating enzyme required for sulfatase activity